MGGFVANGSVAPAEDPLVLVNDGWFPDLNFNDLRASIRLDSSITDERLSMAATNAMISVNRELAQFKSGHQAAGHEALSTVLDERIGGEPVLVHLYTRAVYCTTAAEIAERYRSYDSTGAGGKSADELTPSIDEYRRDVRFAIRDLLGHTHSTVELI